MDLSGETLIAAPRARVWAALNDPAVLARCIEGVESLERVGDNRFEGRVLAKVGPVRATFAGAVELSQLDPPAGYTITGEGKGGAAGFAKGGADIALAEEGDGTRVRWTARANVGGKLAQLGGRLIEGTARGYADRFFAALKAELEVVAEPAAIAAAPEMAGIGPAPVTLPGGPAERGGVSMTVWVAVLVVAVLALLAYLVA